MLMLDVADRPLGLRECVPLTGAQSRRLDELDRYDMWFVAERLADEGRLPEDSIPGAIVEYKKYVALIVLGHRGLGVPSADVDEVWHAHILFTREYAAFCGRIGTGFIHHVPHTSRSPDLAPRGPSYGELHEEYFGGPSPGAAESALCSDRRCKPPCNPDPYGCHDRVVADR